MRLLASICFIVFLVTGPLVFTHHFAFDAPSNGCSIRCCCADVCSCDHTSGSIQFGSGCALPPTEALGAFPSLCEAVLVQVLSSEPVIITISDQIFRIDTISAGVLERPPQYSLLIPLTGDCVS